MRHFAWTVKREVKLTWLKWRYTLEKKLLNGLLLVVCRLQYDEVARQLSSMLEAGVTEPLNSPWSSPVVMVGKKVGSLKFCVDYRRLNKVTRKDTFPLPRVDDPLDQIGQSKYFTTLELASGYWQIRISPGSREKTAFVTPYGLFQFRVMSFAPAVFQRLMQIVLMGLNPVDGN